MAKLESTVKTWNWQDNPAACAGFATAPTIVDDDHCTTALDQMISFALMPSDSLIQLRGKVNWLMHPHRPKDFPRPEAKGNLEIGGDV